MADRVSARRGTANGFYFTISSALLAASESLGLAIASGAGLVLTAAWWLQLRSYRNLNAAKWDVIGKLEQHLPAKPFSDEWTILKTDAIERQAVKFPWLTKMLKPLARYAELSVIEQVVPSSILRAVRRLPWTRTHMSQSYIQHLADDIRARVPGDVIPNDADQLFLIYAALALAKGERVDRRDVHNAWAAWMASRDPSHDSIKPYDDLPADVRNEDGPFVQAIRGAARALDDPQST